MNKNIVRIAIVVVAILLAALILRWAVVRFSAPKKITKPEAVSTTTAVASGGDLKNAKDLLKQGKRAQAIGALEAIVSSRGGSKQAYQSLLQLADIYKADNNLLRTKEIYLSMIKEYPDYCDYPDLQKRLTALNMDILFSKIPAPGSEIYTVKPGDSLSKIAKAHSASVGLIKRANGLSSDVIKPGMKLKVQKRPFSIIVDKSQSTLTLVSGDEVIKTYPVSTGKNNSTPTGTFKIINKLIGPVWYSAGAVVPADSPENVLGSRWMGITTPEPGYGIHGTIKPESIGYQSTEGCVRMHNSDVEELFDIAPAGTEVTIID